MSKLIHGFLFIILVGGCSTTYEPHLTLPPTELTRSIDARVEVHPLIASEELVSGHAPYGVLAEDYINKPPSELSQALTKEVIAELSSRQVFREVSTYDGTATFSRDGSSDSSNMTAENCTVWFRGIRTHWLISSAPTPICPMVRSILR